MTVRPAFAALLSLALSSAPVFAQTGSATYQLTFESIWSSRTHPVQFPPNPHYSPLIGGTHDGRVEFWRSGQLASNGIEVMAETGGTTPLRGELNQAITAGTADQVLQFSGLGTSPALRTVRFTVHAEHSRLTLVSMLAPSPDWFVGVNGLELIQNGRWVPFVEIPLFAYDAGTDSGTTYQSANANTNPPQPIDRVTTASGPFAGTTGPVGYFTLWRLSSSLVYGCGTNPSGSISVSDTPPVYGGLIGGTLHDPTLGLTSPAVSVLVVSALADPAFPCGTPIPGHGLGASRLGELLVSPPFPVIAGPAWNGVPAPFALRIPPSRSVLGTQLYMQGALVDATRLGFTDALDLFIGQP